MTKKILQLNASSRNAEAGIFPEHHDIHRELNKYFDETLRTFMAEKRVRKIDPKYTAVKGSRGPEIRCFV